MEIFECRQRNFMKHYLHDKFTRERFAVELRKKKRRSILDKKRHANGGIEDQEAEDQDMGLRFSAILPEIFKSLSKENNIGGLAGNIMFDEGMVRLIDCLLESLSRDDEGILEASLNILEAVTGVEDCLKYMKNQEVYRKIFRVLELGIERFYPKIVVVFANLCDSSDDIVEVLLKNNYLNKLYMIVFKNTHFSNLAALALQRIVQKASVYKFECYMDSIIKILNIVKANPINDKIILQILECLMEKTFDKMLWECTLDVVLRQIKGKKSVKKIVAIISLLVRYDDFSLQILNQQIINYLAEIFIIKEQCRVNIMFIASNIAGGNNLDICNLLCSNMRKIVIESINHIDIDLRIECSYVFMHISIKGSELQKISMTDENIFKKIALTLGVDLTLDKNYLVYIYNCLDCEKFDEKILQMYYSSNIHEKVAKLELSKNKEVSMYAQNIIEKISMISIS